MASIRVSNVFVTKFEEALARMQRNSDSIDLNGDIIDGRAEVPRKLAIEEFLEEMGADLKISLDSFAS